MQTIVVQTLGDLKEHGYLMYGQCTQLDCRHGRALDLAKLIAQFGSDFVYVRDNRISAALRCRRCGGKGGTCHIAPSSEAIKIGNLASQAADAARWRSARSQ